ncbi:MAG: tripartite tricarboxylate transporter substrate-binding protein [Pseudomonadota bacterium]
MHSFLFLSRATSAPRWWLGLLALALLVPLAASAQGARRVALLIGNAQYGAGMPPLSYPLQDVNVMEQSLRRLGFEVQSVRNADHKGMGRAIRDFGIKAQGAEVAFVYYSGHGMQAREENYLIPIGASIDTEADLEIEAIALKALLRQVQDAQPRATVIVLDACRDNPVAGRTKSATKGLSRVANPPNNSLVVFAALPGTTATDNGVFAKELARQIVEPNVGIRSVFDRVGAAVRQASSQRQAIQRDDQLSEDVVLALASRPAAPINPVARPAQGGGVSLDDLEKEEAARKEWGAWQARMKADFDRTAAFSGSADLQAKAWERFLATWGQDNPTSREDEQLRDLANARRGEAAARAAQPVQVAIASPNAGGMAAPRIAGAGSWTPNKPLRLVVPFPAGGTTDIVARRLAQHLSTSLGQPVVIDNRPGSGGTIGADAVAKSAADGYTLLMATTGTNVLWPMMLSAPPFDGLRDFTPVSTVAAVPMVLAVPASSKTRTLRDFIAAARGRSLTFATAGSGTMAHLAAAMLGMDAGFQFVHVPYRGVAPAMVDLMGGQTDAMFVEASSAAPHIQSGKLVALAVTSAARQPALPNVPTLAESGVGGLQNYEAVTHYALLAPAGTPANVVARLNAEVRGAVERADMREQLQQLGMSVAAGSPELLKSQLESDAARWGRVIRTAGIRVE